MYFNLSKKISSCTCIKLQNILGKTVTSQKHLEKEQQLNGQQVSSESVGARRGKRSPRMLKGGCSSCGDALRKKHHWRVRARGGICRETHLEAIYH